MDRIQITPELDFSRIVYGMWRLGDDADTSPAHVQAKIEACLDQGITTMDQADIYGGYMAEEIMGAALKQAPALRDRIEIVTKCDIVIDAGRHAGAPGKYYDTSRAHITAAVDASLSLMGLDRIDLLLIHRPDPLMDHHDTGRTLDDLVASGKVRAVGVSNFRPWDWDLLQSAMETPLATNQIELSLASHDAFVNGDLAHLQRLGRPAMAWSPLAGGALLDGSHPALHAEMTKIAKDTGTDVSAVATAWLLAHPARILPVMGTNNIKRIKALSDAFKIRLTRPQWFALYTAARGKDVA
ncbi:aldo/keto reductase [Loktanella sp. SALINAS62]|uniref:aldo/keto reductase n=1 Tax=Loktanella sp. SALINAS62 TaxID=2706124 RepID=UPI001B8D9647|nr:aldo/keto reductase [Loktanella sp. SALINAS62]MBS1304267.1 oxidoreductase [Loktanella sp. SALINAS62]